MNTSYALVWLPSQYAEKFTAVFQPKILLT